MDGFAEKNSGLPTEMRMVRFRFISPDAQSIITHVSHRRLVRDLDGRNVESLLIRTSYKSERPGHGYLHEGQQRLIVTLSHSAIYRSSEISD